MGLYLSPPEHDIQALDRTQPGLPLKQGRCQTMTHDHRRNGTTPVFAALWEWNPQSSFPALPFLLASGFGEDRFFTTLTQLQAWRSEYYRTAENTGPAANSAGRHLL